MKMKSIIEERYEDIQNRKIIFRILLGAIIFLSLLYMYFIGSITFNILARKSLEITLQDLGNNLSHTEIEYMALSNKINSDFGKQNGFMEAHGVIFAEKDINRVALR